MSSLRDLLRATLNIDPAVRVAAEQKLGEARSSDAFIFTCLDAIVDTEPTVALAAALYLKNALFVSWQTCDRQDQKELFRDKLIKTMVVVPHPQVLPHLTAIVAFLLASDPFPQSWPNLVPAITELLSIDGPRSPIQVYCGLLCLNEILRYHRWHLDSDLYRQSMADLTVAFFPTLVSMGTSLITSISSSSAQSVTEAEVLWKILKAYKLATEAQLHPYLQRRDQLEQWIKLSLWIIQFDPTAPGSPKPDASTIAGSSPWHKCKKWAFEIINRLFIRYTMTPGINESVLFVPIPGTYAEFSNEFLSVFAPEITKQYIELVQRHTDGSVPLDERTARSVVIFFRNTILVEPLWQLVLSRLELILSKFIFSVLRLTEDDLSMLLYEPDQFIYGQSELYDDESRVSSRAETRTLLRSLAGNRQSDVLSGILMFINSLLEKYHQNPSSIDAALDKDSGLQIMIAISSAAVTKESPIIQGQMDQFITAYVLPDLSSPHLFLRARALQVIAAYSDVHLSEPTLSNLGTEVVRSIASDCLVVSINAVLAFNRLKSVEFVRRAQSQTIHNTMESILKLYENDVASEILSEVMEGLVTVFSEELVPFAAELCRHLADQFLRSLQDLVEAESQQQGNIDYTYLDEKAESAQKILATLSTLMWSLQDYPDELAQLDTTVQQVAGAILSSSEVDLYSDAIELVDASIVTRTTVSPVMWSVFDNSLLQVFRNEPDEFMEEVLPCIHNYVAYGSSGLSKPRCDAILEIVQSCLSNQQLEGGIRANAALLGQLFFTSAGRHPTTAEIAGNLFPSYVRIGSDSLQPGMQWGAEMNLVASAIWFDVIRAKSALVEMGRYDLFVSEWLRATVSSRVLIKLNVAAGLRLLTVDDLSPVSSQIYSKIMAMLGTLQSPRDGEVASPGPTAANFFDFVDESDRYAERGNFVNDYSDMIHPVLEDAINRIDLAQFYREALQGSKEVLVQGLSEQQRSVHFTLVPL